MHTVSIVFVPADDPLDGTFAKRCLGYIDRQGHTFHALLRDWNTVVAKLDAGEANCVVFATRKHYRHGNVSRAEFADGETTQVIRQRNAAVGRHRAPGIEAAHRSMTNLLTLNAEIDWYRRGHNEGRRDGYADGFVDCLRLKAEREQESP